MACLTILIHQGCLSEHAVRRLAEEVQSNLPDWVIEIKPAELSAVSGSIVTFPAFIVDGEVLATGLPRKEWLLQQLQTQGRERG